LPVPGPPIRCPALGGTCHGKSGGFPMSSNQPLNNRWCILTPWSLPLETWLTQIGEGGKNMKKWNFGSMTNYVHPCTSYGFPPSHQLFFKSCVSCHHLLPEATQLGSWWSTYHGRLPPVVGSSPDYAMELVYLPTCVPT
jgi:hypothetical protein